MIFGLSSQQEAILFHTLRTNENLTIAPVSQQLVKLVLFIFTVGLNISIKTNTNRLSKKNYRTLLRPSPCRRGVGGEPKSPLLRVQLRDAQRFEYLYVRNS